MSRPLRIEFAGALYHVTSRGDGQKDIYLDDQDRRDFTIRIIRGLQALQLDSSCLLFDEQSLPSFA